MHRARRLLITVCVLAYGAAGVRAQTPTGTLAGAVTGPSDTKIAATITITAQATGLTRTLNTSAGGRYAAPFLVPGDYDICASNPAFQSMARHVSVRAGTTTTVDFLLELAPLTTALTVKSGPRARSDQVGGGFDLADVAFVPLNGRNPLELAKLEPGVAQPERLTGGRVFVAPLGAGLNTVPRIGFTRVTFDGAHVETPGTVGTLMQISPDVVDQMSITTANFDPSTGPATSGAVNIVSRSGGNRYVGSAFYLIRDQRWSAESADLPGSSVTDPDFRRQQGGGTVSGPILANRAFFVVGYERHDQQDVIPIALADPALTPLGGRFVSPYAGTLASGRIDVRLSDRHQVFLRHTRDEGRAFALNGSATLPSGWAGRPLLAHQTLAAATSILTSRLVNDLRVSSYTTFTAQNAATLADCATPCFGLDAPRIQLSDGGPAILSLGTSATSSAKGVRFEFSDNLAWQRGPHLLRVGVDWESVRQSQTSSDSDPVQITLWTPEAVRQRAPSIVIPSSLDSVEALLQLPLRSFTTSVGPGEILQRGFTSTRRLNLFRLYAGDQWTAGRRFTVNAGFSWSLEPRVLNSDLTKPEWLSPLVGADGLTVPDVHSNLSGMIGLAWTATSDGRTTVRAAAGRYFESIARTVALNLATERVLLSPVGTGRVTISGSNLIWDGRRLNFPQPTTFTGADLLAILPALRSAIGESLSPDNRNFSVVNLDIAKEGRNLYDPNYTTPRALHASVGVDHDFGHSLVLGADFVFKEFAHTFINGIDYNRFFSAAGPVIPVCLANERIDPAVHCSNGSLYFDTTSGKARYLGLLVRAEKRFGRGLQLRVSYAFGSFVGNNGTATGTTEDAAGRATGFNNDDWNENYGPLPTDFRHVLNLAGTIALPFGVRLAANLSAHGRPPFSAYVAGMDFNGDGTNNDLLPGSRVNQFNRGLDTADLVRLVSDYNDTIAGTQTAGGQQAPVLTLPDHFAFNDNFATLDVRLERPFAIGPSVHLTAIVEIFNVLNTANFTNYGSNLAAPSSFGQPLSRVGQAFGSGGPRSAQLGLRLNF